MDVASTMDSGLMVYRLLLAVPLVVAGLRRLPGGRRAISLGVAELAAGAGLMSSVTAWPSAFLALACLWLPAASAAVDLARRNLAQSNGAAGLDAVVRATVLAVPAVLVLWEGYQDAGPSIFGWLASLTPVQQVTVVAGVAALAVASTRYGRSAAPTRDQR